MLGWNHSGFSAHLGVKINAADVAGRERPAQYMLRCPFSLERMILSHRAGQGPLPRPEERPAALPQPRQCQPLRRQSGGRPELPGL